jgi:hypothetical protein
VSSERNCGRPLGQGAAVMSLIAALTCALTADALATQAPIDTSVSEPELSARAGALRERVRLLNPTLLRNLPENKKIVQWRN